MCTLQKRALWSGASSHSFSISVLPPPERMTASVLEACGSGFLGCYEHLHLPLSAECLMNGSFIISSLFPLPAGSNLACKSPNDGVLPFHLFSVGVSLGVLCVFNSLAYVKSVIRPTSVAIITLTQDVWGPPVPPPIKKQLNQLFTFGWLGQ